MEMDDSIELPISNEQRGKEGEKYKKVRILGEGSMGRAYLVECTEDSKLYVMKRINIGHLGPKQKENALRQAQLHSLLSHPNIVQLKEVYQTTGQKICIIMQYAEGGDLQQFIQDQSGKLLSEQKILSMFVQICLGVQEIHAKRIIHRDLKTANIFLTAEKMLKIGDFGISKSLDKTLMAATTMVGTPYYLSPEMVEGKSYSTKADIWALGVILYQLCSLKLPFQANSLPVLALKILKGSFPPIPKQFSKDIKSLILQMLQVDQKKRPSIQAIINKPFIFKCLSKEEQSRQKQKLEQKKPVHVPQQKQKQKKEEDKKLKANDKDKQVKIQSRKEKEQKRQELRKQMREDLRKKRAEKEKQEEGHKAGSSTLVPPSADLSTKKSPMKNIKTELTKAPKPQLSTTTNDNKKQVLEKPWKNRKLGEKKEVTIQMFVPPVKPPVKEEQTILQTSDLKAEIFPASKQEENQRLHSKQQKQQTRKSMPELEAIQNYHFSQKNIKDELQEMEQNSSDEDLDQEFQFQQEQNEYNIEQILDNVKNVQELTKNLPSPSKSICLYEQSQNFDNTILAKVQPNLQGIKDLKELCNSQSLEQLRLILEEWLGVQKFMSAYSVVKQHLDAYYQMAEKVKQQMDRKALKEEFVFNKSLLRERLTVLSVDEFEKSIEWLLTLIMYEDLEMQKNRNQPGKYSNLI